MVNSGQPFAGCDCLNTFEGRHCQYNFGTAPLAELQYLPAQQLSHLSGGVIFVIVLVAVLCLAGISFFIYRNRHAGMSSSSSSSGREQYDSDGHGGVDMSTYKTHAGAPTLDQIHDANDLTLEEVPIDGEGEKRIV